MKTAVVEQIGFVTLINSTGGITVKLVAHMPTKSSGVLGLTTSIYISASLLLHHHLLLNNLHTHHPLRDSLHKFITPNKNIISLNYPQKEHHVGNYGCHCDTEIRWT
jgi:hypothetical protein